MKIQISWLLQKPTDLDQHCLQRQGISGFSRTRVKVLSRTWRFVHSNGIGKIRVPKGKRPFTGDHCLPNADNQDSDWIEIPEVRIYSSQHRAIKSGRKSEYYTLCVFVFCYLYDSLSSCEPGHAETRFFFDIWGQRRPRSACASAQSDQGLHYPLIESLDTTESMMESEGSDDTSRVQDVVNPYIVRMLEGTFSLGTTQVSQVRFPSKLPNNFWLRSSPDFAKRGNWILNKRISSSYDFVYNVKPMNE